MEVHCIAFVEVVTDYLDGSLAPGVVAAIDVHLEDCPGCASVLAQFRETIRQAGRIREQDVARVDPDVQEALMQAFRIHRAEGS